MFFVRLPAVCTRSTLLATTPSLWAKCFPLRYIRVSRCCSFAASTRAFLSDRERSPVFPCSLLTFCSMMPAKGIALHAVFRAPFVGHFVANLPQLREKLVAHAILQNFHWPSFQRFRAKPDRPVNELHVFEAKLLEQFVEVRQRFGHYVGVAVV